MGFDLELRGGIHAWQRRLHRHPSTTIGDSTSLSIISPESLAQVSVQGTGTLLVNEAVVDLSPIPKTGGAVRLIDVGDVVENHQPMIGDALAGDGANLLLVIDKFPGSDTVKVTRGVEEALASLRPGLGGMTIDSTHFRPATFIEMAKGNLSLALIIACVIVLLMLGLFFFDWRAMLISLITIPLSLIAAGLVLYLRGTTLNAMVLVGLGIALGILVDDAIVHVENIKRRLRQRADQSKGETPRSSASVIFESLIETRGALLFATPICLFAALPLFSLQGIVGTFFQPLAVSYVLAVLASTFVALIVTPALCAILLPRVSEAPDARSASPLIQRLQPGYDRL